MAKKEGKEKESTRGTAIVTVEVGLSPGENENA